MGQASGGYGNLGDPRLFNFSESYSPGNQFFSTANPYASVRALLPPATGPNGTTTNAWLGAVGHSYVLQVATNLVNPAWSNASSIVTATVPVVSTVVTNSAPFNFYRSLRLD